MTYGARDFLMKMRSKEWLPQSDAATIKLKKSVVG
jgi:hypothetical protein